MPQGGFLRLPLWHPPREGANQRAPAISIQLKQRALPFPAILLLLVELLVEALAVMAPAVPLAFAAAPVAVHGGVRPQHVRQPDKTALLLVIQALVERRSPLGQKIEAVGNRSIRRSVIGRRAVVGNMQQRIADLAIFVLGCCELHSQNQAQL